MNIDFKAKEMHVLYWNNRMDALGVTKFKISKENIKRAIDLLRNKDIEFFGLSFWDINEHKELKIYDEEEAFRILEDILEGVK